MAAAISSCTFKNICQKHRLIPEKFRHNARNYLFNKIPRNLDSRKYILLANSQIAEYLFETFETFIFTRKNHKNIALIYKHKWCDPLISIKAF